MSDFQPLLPPGAKKKPMLLLGLPPKTLKAPGYFDLEGNEAKNFTDASPETLATGRTLYRVFGGGAGKIGGYWSPAPPAPNMTEGEWRSENAVELAWNAGTTVVSMTITANNGLQCWTGGIESQPAREVGDGNTVIKNIAIAFPH